MTIGIILAIFGILFFIGFSTNKEGFQAAVADAKPKEPVKPDQVAYQLLTTVMNPIRRITSIVTSPTEWKERFTLAQMTPTEIARDYLNKQIKQQKPDSQ